MFELTQSFGLLFERLFFMVYRIKNFKYKLIFIVLVSKSRSDVVGDKRLRYIKWLQYVSVFKWLNKIFQVIPQSNFLIYSSKFHIFLMVQYVLLIKYFQDQNNYHSLNYLIHHQGII
ncbi:hypothetical protein pb186bvf_018931 [Paramecium bursaria]